MNELIKVTVNENNEPAVSGRELYEFLEVDSNYTTWFSRMCDYGFTNETDYITCFPNLESGLYGGQNKTDHVLTLDMAKEICMIQRNEKGKQARQYFIEIEKKYKAQIPALDSRFLFQIAQTLEEKEKLISEMKPKADFFDKVANSKSAIDMAHTAKVLNMGIGRNDLFKFLRENGVLMGDNVPYQEFLDKGYFRTIEQKYTKPDGSTHISIKTLVYQKGLDYIRRLFNKSVKQA